MAKNAVWGGIYARRASAKIGQRICPFERNLARPPGSRLFAEASSCAIRVVGSAVSRCGPAVAQAISTAGCSLRKRRRSMKQLNTHPNFFRDRPEPLPTAPPAAISAFLWSRSGMLRHVFDVVQVVRAWPGVTLRRDHSGVCLALGGVVLGHLRWDGRIDLPFAPETANRLVAEDMARFDPDHPDGDRVVFDLRSP